MTPRFTAILLAVMALAGPALGQSSFATFAPKDEPLPLPKTEPSKKQQSDLPQPAEDPPADPETWSVVPSFLQSFTVGGTRGWQERWWVSIDYMLGWTKPVFIPALVTTSPAGTPKASAGVLGQPGTAVLFGNRLVDRSGSSGIKFDAGTWLTDDKTLGVDIGFFYLPGTSTNFLGTSNGSTILARPFTDVNTGNPASVLVGFPGGSGPTNVKASGSVAVQASSGPLWETHLDFREIVIQDPNYRITSILGYRFMRFNDALNIQQSSMPTDVNPALPPPLKAGTTITSQDSFNANNTFNGCDVGFELELVRRNWSIGWLAKIAVGDIRREVDISGATQVVVPGTPNNNISNGVLALATNAGNHVSNNFGVIPETGLTATWILNDHVRINFGYSVLLFTDVARAADQVSTNVNAKLINTSTPAPAPGSPLAQPAFNLRESNMWIQTFTTGLEFRF